MATFCLLFYPCLLGFLIFRVSGPGGVPSCSGQTQSSGIRIDTSLHQNVESWHVIRWPRVCPASNYKCKNNILQLDMVPGQISCGLHPSCHWLKYSCWPPPCTSTQHRPGASLTSDNYFGRDNELGGSAPHLIFEKPKWICIKCWFYYC